jgi:serine O-acetyltransferase
VPGTVIGARTTIGMGLGDRGLPDIGRNVWIGSDCVVYGTIRIGDGATLLPGTTLSKSIPSGVVMQGNPARMALGDFDNTPLRFQPELDSAEYIAARRST